MKLLLRTIICCLLLGACQKEAPIASSPQQQVREVNTEEYYVPQYRLTSPRTIKVRAASLNSALTTAVSQAIANYNVLNLTLTFQLINTGTADITIQPGTLPAGTLAVSGFPSQNKPYPTILLNTSSQGFGNAANLLIARRVIQHEIGHCIGLIHPDRYINTPCGPAEPGGLGAIHIPGTPTSLDTLSLMLRCNPGNVFSPRDIALLNYLF